MTDEYFDVEIPDWAVKVKAWINKLVNENVSLSLEVDRLYANEEMHYETNEKFDRWINEFILAEGGQELLDKYTAFMDKKMELDDA